MLDFGRRQTKIHFSYQIWVRLSLYISSIIKIDSHIISNSHSSSLALFFILSLFFSVKLKMMSIWNNVHKYEETNRLIFKVRLEVKLFQKPHSNWAITQQKIPKTFLCRRWRRSWSDSWRNFAQVSKSGRPKTVDSDAVLQSIEANPMSSTGRVSGEIGISLSREVRHLHDLGKFQIWSNDLAPAWGRIVPKISQNFSLTLVSVLHDLSHTRFYINLSINLLGKKDFGPKATWYTSNNRIHYFLDIRQTFKVQ